MATMLRHDPQDELLGRMDTAGFVAVEDLIVIPSMRRFDLDEEDVEEIVDAENRDKVRFIKFREADGKLWLRAAQGHSAGVGSRLDMKQVLEVIQPGHPAWSDKGYHGTFLSAWTGILREGLSTAYSRGRQKRVHIHFVREVWAGTPDQPGLRFGTDVVVKVDLLALHAAGAVILKSVTDVLLTEGFGGVVPPQFIEEISTRRGEVLYPPASDLPREIAKELREEQAAAVVSAVEAMAVDKLDDDPEWPLEACFPPAIDEYVEEARPLEVDAAAQVDEYPEPSEEEGEEPGLAAGVPWAPTGPWPLARSGARAGPRLKLQRRPPGRSLNQLQHVQLRPVQLCWRREPGLWRL
jgi:RNA:NAD 2'-phosphotransferase (TPT1/KptA family)